MPNYPEQFLFSGTEVGVRKGNMQRTAFDQIAALNDDHILSKTADELAREIAELVKVEAPVIDPARSYTTSQEGMVPEHTVPNPQFGDHAGTVRGYIYTLHVPYTGDESMFYTKPSQMSPRHKYATTSDTEILFTIAGANLAKPDIDKESDIAIEWLQTNLASLRKEAEAFMRALLPILRTRIEARQETARQNRAIAASLKYPIRKRPDAQPTYTVPAIQRRLTPARVPTRADQAPDPTLSEEHYKEILRIVESMTHVMERSPKAFSNMDEEEIRVHYLVQLNGQYEGQATGETFNFRGKTDILVRFEDQNIFVAECKFWAGAKVLLATIDQLLGYTTWRDTKTALIIFSKLKEFSTAIDEAQRAMKSHPLYVSGPVPEGQTRFRYIFRHPNDPDREVIVTLLLFNIPQPGA